MKDQFHNTFFLFSFKWYIWAVLYFSFVSDQLRKVWHCEKNYFWQEYKWGNLVFLGESENIYIKSDWIFNADNEESASATFSFDEFPLLTNGSTYIMCMRK